ncbi:MAG: cell division protein FtsL [Piscirickettsiaceae bacterium]|nr:MAG: cell division protein FtsL [Piscirickettsiaceae bacterium]PCI70818.1 MAG: cell division protein FtsL [Piscirickettsiaceae bacterium]
MSDASKISIVLLLPMVIMSALVVVYVKYQERVLFTELKKEIYHQDKLEVEWSRLQLEQHTWSSSSRIEKLAKQKLGLQAPTTEQIVFIKVK